MKVTIKSYITKGGVCIPVWNTTTIENGIGIHVAGHLNDTDIKEMLIRACTALQSAGYSIPGKRVIIEVKAGDDRPVATSTSNLDLPVALSVILASGQQDAATCDISCYAFVGELGLNGEVRGVRDADIIAKKPNGRRMVFPTDNRHDILAARGRVPAEKFFAVSEIRDVFRMFANPDTFDVCVGPILTRFRSRCFDIANAGKHGRYPDGMDEFNRAVEEGFSDGGMTWTAKDGTVFSCDDEIPD